MLSASFLFSILVTARSVVSLNVEICLHFMMIELLKRDKQIKSKDINLQ